MKRTILLSFLLAFAIELPAMGDPDFEVTKPGPLPQWGGALWAKASTIRYDADIIENPAQAASGKHFLRVNNPQKTTAYVIAYPKLKSLPGNALAYKISGKVRGTATAAIGFFVYDKNSKLRKWRSTWQTAFKKLSPDKWQDFTITYTPVDGDHLLSAALLTRNGIAEYDSMKVETVKAVAPAKKAVRKAVRKAAPKKAALPKPRTVTAGKHYQFFDFETWANPKSPANWQTDPDDRTTVISKALNAAGEQSEFGRNSLFLNGVIISTPPMTNLAVPRGRPIRVSFYAKGEHGSAKLALRQGRSGNVDYLVNVIDAKTTAVWQKFAAELSLHPNARIDNIAVELTGKNVFIDNLEFYAVKGKETKITLPIPQISAVPVIDGNISPGEWDFATGASDPFQQHVPTIAAYKPTTPAIKQQSSYRLCSDGKYLYFRCDTPNAGKLKRDFTGRDSKCYLDDSIEIHINPEFGNVFPARSYQFVFNANGAIFDQQMIKGARYPESINWNAKTIKVASKIDKNVWILEGRIALSEIGLAPERSFGLNIAVNRHNPVELGILNGAAFYEYGERMPEARISSGLPGVFWSRNGADWGNILVEVANSSKSDRSYLLQFTLDAERNKRVIKQELKVLPNSRNVYFFNIPGGAGIYGRFALDVMDKKGKKIYTQGIDFNQAVSALQPQSEKHIEFHVLPEQKKYAVNLHLNSGIFDDLAFVTVDGVGNSTIYCKKQSFRRFGDVAVFKAPLPMTDGKTCTFRAAAFNTRGELIASTVKKFTANNALMPKDNDENYQEILPPYTPIKLQGNVAKVSMRDYNFSGNALPQSITAKGSKVLASPVQLTAIDGSGKKLTGKNGKFKIISKRPDQMVFSGETIFPGFTVKLTGTLVYDGTIFYNAEMIAPKPVKLQNLAVEVPFCQLDYFHSFLDSQLRLWMCRQPKAGEYRHKSVKVWTPDTIMVYPDGLRGFSLYFFPAGDGVIWSSRNVVPGVIKNGFLPYLTFGNYKYGMVFFADTDRGWVHNKDSHVHQIIRKGGVETVRTNIIAMPFTVHGKRTFEFGLMATPGKNKTRGTSLPRYWINGWSHTGFTDQAYAGMRIKNTKLFDEQFKRFRKRGISALYYACKGFFPQMDPVAQYLDSEWRTRPDYVFKDGYANVGARFFGTDQRYYFSPAGCYTPARISFLSERFKEMLPKMPNIAGNYWDENWMKPCNNPNHADCGYIMPDGQLQGRAWWRGVREVDRRLRQIFRANGCKNPLFILFTGEGLIPHAFAFGDVNLLGEHITYDTDYVDYWTPHFMEIAAAGAWGFDTGFLGMFRDAKYLPRIDLHRAQLAMLKVHDTHFYSSYFNSKLSKKMRMIEEDFNTGSSDIEFVGYYSDEGKKAAPGLPSQVKASAYVRPGKNALIYISNFGETDITVNPGFDFSQWGIAKFSALDAETGKAVDVSKIRIKRHDFRVIKITK